MNFLLFLLPLHAGCFQLNSVALTTDTDLDYRPVEEGSEMYRGMNYMSEDNVVVCACAKCGSTSLFSFLFDRKFGKKWEYQGAPYLQEVWSDRWGGKFTVVKDMPMQERIMHSAFSFALVREPKERVLSAWSSKVACVDQLSQDTEDRALFVPSLIELAGLNWTSSCLSIHDFLVVLRRIHMLNRTLLLNDHFRPQTEECFLNHPPEKWSNIVSISAPGALTMLSGHLVSPNAELEGEEQVVAPVTHTSSHKEYFGLTLEDEILLDAVTEKEYRALGQYLPQAWARWNLTTKDTFCSNSMDLGSVNNIGQCKTLAENNAACGWQVWTDGKSCGCVTAGQWCAMQPSTQSAHLYQYLRTRFWSLVSEDAFCRDSTDLGVVADVAECQQKVSADASCGDQLFTNGKSCACVATGQMCNLQDSEEGYAVYRYRSHA